MRARITTSSVHYVIAVIQAKCTELVVIRARMSDLLWCIKRCNSLTHSIGQTLVVV